MIGYLNGYRGLLIGESITFPSTVREQYSTLYDFGGSPIGNSRVKLTNVEDCIKRGYVQDGENPLKVAADQMTKDGIDILHTIGGDDTNTMAYQLSFYLKENGYDLTVVGLPKLLTTMYFSVSDPWCGQVGAGSGFFENAANENTTSTRQLIIHEVMEGTVAGSLLRLLEITEHDWHRGMPELLVSKDRWDVDAIFVPEQSMDLTLR